MRAHYKLFIYMAIALASLFYVAHLLADDCQGDYKRSCYKHWSDLNHDGFDTRQEILIRDSLIDPVIENGRVISGLWVDPYTGTTSEDPSDFDIEHGYALKDAHIAGANLLSPERKELFANDERHLFAAWKKSNRAKGAGNLLEWIPADLSFLNDYAQMRRLMIAEYKLTPNVCEAKALWFFEGFGEHFEKGINLLKVKTWVVENFHVFHDPCFQE